MVLRAPAINYHLKGEASFMLRCHLCSTRYTALRIKNCLKSTYAINKKQNKKQTIIKNMDDFHYELKPSCATTKLTLRCQQR